MCDNLIFSIGFLEMSLVIHYRLAENVSQTQNQFDVVYQGWETKT